MPGPGIRALLSRAAKFLGRPQHPQTDSRSQTSLSSLTTSEPPTARNSLHNNQDLRVIHQNTGNRLVTKVVVPLGSHDLILATKSTKINFETDRYQNLRSHKFIASRSDYTAPNIESYQRGGEALLVLNDAHSQKVYKADKQLKVSEKLGSLDSQFVEIRSLDSKAFEIRSEIELHEKQINKNTESLTSGSLNAKESSKLFNYTTELSKNLSRLKQKLLNLESNRASAIHAFTNQSLDLLNSDTVLDPQDEANLKENLAGLGVPDSSFITIDSKDSSLPEHSLQSTDTGIEVSLASNDVPDLAPVSDSDSGSEYSDEERAYYVPDPHSDQTSSTKSSFSARANRPLQSILHEVTIPSHYTEEGSNISE